MVTDEKPQSQCRSFKYQPVNRRERERETPKYFLFFLSMGCPLKLVVKSYSGNRIRTNAKGSDFQILKICQSPTRTFVNKVEKGLKLKSQFGVDNQSDLEKYPAQRYSIIG